MLPIRTVYRMDGQTDGRTEGASPQYHLISYLWNSCYAFGVPRAFHALEAPLVINIMINALLNHL